MNQYSFPDSVRVSCQVKDPGTRALAPGGSDFPRLPHRAYGPHLTGSGKMLQTHAKPELRGTGRGPCKPLVSRTRFGPGLARLDGWGSGGLTNQVEVRGFLKVQAPSEMERGPQKSHYQAQKYRKDFLDSVGSVVCVRSAGAVCMMLGLIPHHMP